MWSQQHKANTAAQPTALLREGEERKTPFQQGLSHRHLASVHSLQPWAAWRMVIEHIQDAANKLVWLQLTQTWAPVTQPFPGTVESFWLTCLSKMKPLWATDLCPILWKRQGSTQMKGWSLSARELPYLEMRFTICRLHCQIQGGAESLTAGVGQYFEAYNEQPGRF